MNRDQARSRLEQTSNFKLVGGRVLITDKRTLSAVAELRATEASRYPERSSSTRPMPTSNQTSA